MGGLRLSIDDICMGHSSLAHLAKLTVDGIKIDRVFIRSAIRCATNARICRDVIELAHGLGVKVTAEGVETSGQGDWLRDIGCDPLQGFLFDRPAPSADFEPWLRPGANGRAMQEAGRLAGWA
jgi:EAL domain-containing protein (putative c-di-GMP-specific phosphodiesterase class I)